MLKMRQFAAAMKVVTVTNSGAGNSAPAPAIRHADRLQLANGIQQCNIRFSPVGHWLRDGVSCMRRHPPARRFVLDTRAFEPQRFKQLGPGLAGNARRAGRPPGSLVTRRAGAASRRKVAGEAMLNPVERLRGAINLIIMPAIGEPEQLIKIVGQPRRFTGQEHSSGFEHHTPGLHPGKLLDSGTDKQRLARRRRSPEILGDAATKIGILDNRPVSAPRDVHLFDSVPQLRHFHFYPINVQQVDLTVSQTPDSTD